MIVRGSDRLLILVPIKGYNGNKIRTFPIFRIREKGMFWK